MRRLKQAPGIIPALDTTLGAALVAAYQLRDLSKELSGFKIGSDTVEIYGFNTVVPLMNEIAPNIEKIYDGQKKGSDIPDQIVKDVKRAGQYGFGAYIANVLGSGSYRNPSEPKVRGSLEAFVDTCKEVDMAPIVVLKMTQPGDDAFLKPNAGELLARLVVEYEVSYVVAPANKPEYTSKYQQIFHEAKINVEIISPGVGKQKTGDPLKDAEGAVLAGADHIVAGRAVLNSVEPKKAVEDLYAIVVKAHK